MLAPAALATGLLLMQMIRSNPQIIRQPPAVHLLADPEMVVQSAGVRVGLSKVTKEPKSPILVADQPWEIWVSYVSVVYAPEIKRLVFYYTNVMCCDAFSGVSACPGTENRTVYICDDPRNMKNVTGTQNNPRLTATLRAESIDGVVWTKPPMHQVAYNGSTANNAVELNQSLGGSSDGRGVFRDPYDLDPRRRYKMVGVFNRGPNNRLGAIPHAATAAATAAAAATAPAGYIEEPGCIPAGRCISDIRHSTVADGAKACSALPQCASFSFYAHTGWVQLFDLNQTEHPLPNPPWTSYRKARVPTPPKPDPLARFPGYHFGTAASADGKHWHSFTDISKQLQARADTSNNAVYDPDSKEFMIFTRLDCRYPPFNTNPSLIANCSKPWGLRRSARSVSKAWGSRANWSVAAQCSHGESGDEQYTLNPWREPSWRPGLWMGLASFYHTGTGSVHSELLISTDHAASWSRVAAPGTPFIPHGQQPGAFDSMGIYAGNPLTDPQNPGRLLVYYEGVNVPHDQSAGHSKYGLAYSPVVPAGLLFGAGFSSAASNLQWQQWAETRMVDISGDTLWVLGDLSLLAPDGGVDGAGLTIEARPALSSQRGGGREVGKLLWRAVRFSAVNATVSTDMAGTSSSTSGSNATMPVRRRVLGWQRIPNQARDDDNSSVATALQLSTAPLSEILGARASFVFRTRTGAPPLAGGVLHAFGFQ